MSFPINPSLNQEIVKGNKTYKWTGFSWSRVATTAVSLASNAITTNAIQNGSITSVKIDPTFVANIALISNLTSYATTTHVSNEVANLVASAPSTLNTLNELAIALGNNASFATTVATSLSTKANTASLTTANVTEVSNLYFTNTRAISAFTSGSGISIAANGRITGASQYSNTDVQAYLGNISGALIPSVNELYNLGSSTRKWANLFLSGNTIYLGQTKLESSSDGSLSIKSTNAQITTAISFSSNGYIATPSGPLATASGSVSATPRIANVRVTDSTYANILDDTAANSQGYVEINGANFDNGATAIIGTTTASSVTFVNSTRLRVGLPTLSAGTYPVYVVNSDGSTAIRVNGLNISGTPLWTTASGFLANVYESNPISLTINAVSDSNIFYSVVSGSLPTGSNLNPANGYISNGNTTLISGNTVYNFTVNASDVELQNTTRAFSISVLNDVVFFNNTFTSISLSNTVGQAATIDVSAVNLSNTPVSYSSNSLANGLVLNSNGVITGVFTSVQNITSVITATAGYTLATNTKTLDFIVNPEVVAVCFLVVGGGGGASRNSGGGGGGGFLNYLSPTPTLSEFYVRVGAGGVSYGGTGPGFWGRGCNGTCSQAGSCIAGGGFGEGGFKSGGGSGCPQNVAALGSIDGYNNVAAGGSGAGGQGNNTGTDPAGGPGCSFSPLSRTYAGGGGFSCDFLTNTAKAGRDGGGNGVDCGYPSAAPGQVFASENGEVNRGGGGAGGWRSASFPDNPGYGNGGSGGSGVVKILLPSGKGIGGGAGLTFTCNTIAIPNCVVVCFTAGAGNVCITS